MHWPCSLSCMYVLACSQEAGQWPSLLQWKHQAAPQSHCITTPLSRKPETSHCITTPLSRKHIQVLHCITTRCQGNLKQGTLYYYAIVKETWNMSHCITTPLSRKCVVYRCKENHTESSFKMVILFLRKCEKNHKSALEWMLVKISSIKSRTSIHLKAHNPVYQFLFIHLYMTVEMLKCCNIYKSTWVQF